VYKIVPSLLIAKPEGSNTLILYELMSSNPLFTGKTSLFLEQDTKRMNITLSITPMFLIFSSIFYININLYLAKNTS
jgi:hypothetical protein